MVCTSSSFSHTKLKRMRISGGDVQKLVKRGGEAHAEHFQHSLSLALLSVPNVVEMDTSPPPSSAAVKGNSLSSTPSLVNLRDPFALNGRRQQGESKEGAVDAATVNVQDYWDVATTNTDYFGTVEPPKRVPSRPSLTRESTFEAFFKDTGLLSTAASNMWEDFDSASLYGIGSSPPQLPKELSNEHLDMFLPPLPPAAERESSIPLDLFSGLISGGDDLFGEL